MVGMGTLGQGIITVTTVTLIQKAALLTETAVMVKMMV